MPCKYHNYPARVPTVLVFTNIHEGLVVVQLRHNYPPKSCRAQFLRQLLGSVVVAVRNFKRIEYILNTLMIYSCNNYQSQKLSQKLCSAGFGQVVVTELYNYQPP